MTTDTRRYLAAVACGLAVVLLAGCRAPLVAVTKIYTVHQYGLDGNRVDVEVLKEQDITPQTTGVTIKAK